LAYEQDKGAQKALREALSFELNPPLKDSAQKL
jgi:hypothetical protein